MHTKYELDKEPGESNNLNIQEMALSAWIQRSHRTNLLNVYVENIGCAYRCMNDNRSSERNEEQENILIH